MKEKKDRLDDALQATKAAIDEGVLQGAGVALLRARNAINNRDNTDFGKGGQIVFNACETPFQQILKNAGENPTKWEIILKDVDKKHVPDIANETIVDAFAAGIIDPTKVVRSALENAAAAAVTLLMTECVIHDKPTDKKKSDEFDMAGMGM